MRDMTDDEVRVLAEFEYHGSVYRTVTWRSDGHSRLRLVIREEPVNDFMGHMWQVVFIL